MVSFDDKLGVSSSFISLHHSFLSFCALVHVTANRQGAEIKSEKESSQKKEQGADVPTV